MKKISYAPNTVFIVQFSHPLIRVREYMKTGVLSKSKDLIVLKSGTHGSAQYEFQTKDICECHKELILSILN